MKPLKCEMCGSPNIIKQDGIFICQNCNTKYSVEEAKKMMIDGTVTVQVDSSEELKNLYQLARRAKDSANEDAKKYYDMILLKEPNSWEAIFYSKYTKSFNVLNGNVESVLFDISSSIEIVLNLIKVLTEEEKKDALNKLILDIGKLGILIFESANREMEETKNPEVFSMFFQNCVAAIALLEGFANMLEISFPGEEYIYTICTDFWERVINYRAKLSPYLDDKKLNQEFINKLAEKIKKCKADYQCPETIKKGPCYVATAIYGSYDCPEVWVLRRFRDNVLNTSWYGKWFICFYYAIAPYLVRIFGESYQFNKFIKKRLDVFVSKLKIKGFDDTPYQDKK